VTEQEWLAGADPESMLAFLRERASARKFRLFACACCHRIRPLMGDERSWRAVLAAEAFADGRVPEQAFEDARWEATKVLDLMEVGTTALYAAEAACSACWDDFPTDGEEAFGAAQGAAGHCRRAAGLVGPPAVEFALQASLGRCVFGNPFRPVALDPSCLTPTVAALAAQMYETRDFSAMPVLADALQEAGCEDEQILGHCRGDGAHVRGCWVVDLVLGEE
jgi:hypothetical protein